MAIANLQESIQAAILRRNALIQEIASYQVQKNLAVYSQADVQSLLSSEKHAIRDKYKFLYKDCPELQEDYKDYTEIPEFEEEIDRITAMYQEQLDELSAWETMIDAQITTADTEKAEIDAWLDSYKSMLSSNIQDDFEFGLNG